MFHKSQKQVKSKTCSKQYACAWFGGFDRFNKYSFSASLGTTVYGIFNFKEGKKILDESNLKILSASDLNDAAKKIVEAIK